MCSSRREDRCRATGSLRRDVARCASSEDRRAHSRGCGLYEDCADWLGGEGPDCRERGGGESPAAKATPAIAIMLKTAQIRIPAKRRIVILFRANVYRCIFLYRTSAMISMEARWHLTRSLESGRVAAQTFCCK